MPDVTVRDVARRAGVSAGTVSNFFNVPEKVGPDTAHRIAAAIEELGYVGNGAARMLRGGRSTTIGHLTIELGNPFFASVAEGVEQASESAGFAVFLANSAGSERREARYLDLFELQRVRGLVLSAVGDVSAPVRRLRDRGIPSVVIDQVVDTALGGSVVVDDAAGGLAAVQHLLDTGARRIAFIGGPLGIATVASRLRGARTAIAHAGAATLQVIVEEERTIAAGRRRGEEIGRLSAADRPDGVFAANDLLAIGMMHGLLQCGVRIPDEVAIIGYDGIDFAADSVIPLSTVRRPAEEFGQAAVQLLLEAIGQDHPAPGRTVVFQPTLVPRASTLRGTSA